MRSTELWHGDSTVNQWPALIKATLTVICPYFVASGEVAGDRHRKGTTGQLPDAEFGWPPFRSPAPAHPPQRSAAYFRARLLIANAGAGSKRAIPTALPNRGRRRWGRASFHEVDSIATSEAADGGDPSRSKSAAFGEQRCIARFEIGDDKRRPRRLFVSARNRWRRGSPRRGTRCAARCRRYRVREGSRSRRHSRRRKSHGH
jgi:hypothetical protein